MVENTMSENNMNEDIVEDVDMEPTAFTEHISLFADPMEDKINT